MQPEFRQLAAASTVTDSSARPGPEGQRPGPGHLPGSGLVICAITARVSEHGPEDGPFAGVWGREFAGPGRVAESAQKFGRDVLEASADMPDWAIVVAPGVVRLAGRDLEQSWWADQRAIEPYRARLRPVTRSEVTAWTRKSRAKMTLTLASLDWSYLEQATGLPAMVTLTYPADWVTVAPSGQAVKGHLRVLQLRWLRAWGEPLTAAWKLEFQARGAPHVHIGPVVVPLGKAGELRSVTAVRRRPAVGDGLQFNKWLSLVWADIVNHPDPGERERHERAGTGVDYAEGLRCADPKRLAIYFSKHGSWVSKDYQNRVPDEWREQGKGPGRFWGYWNLSPCRAMVELRKDEHLLMSRTLRHMSARSRVWDPSARQLVTVKAMREVVVDRRRIDKLTGAVKVRKRKVRRPVRRLKYHRGFVCVNDGPGLAVTLARLIERQADMIIVKPLAGCPVKGCFVKYPTGEPRLCHDHALDAAGDALSRMAELTREAPVGHAVQECQVALPLLSGAIESASARGKR